MRNEIGHSYKLSLLISPVYGQRWTAYLLRLEELEGGALAPELAHLLE
jgi:hypothetical protein